MDTNRDEVGRGEGGCVACCLPSTSWHSWLGDVRFQPHDFIDQHVNMCSNPARNAKQSKANRIDVDIGVLAYVQITTVNITSPITTCIDRGLLHMIHLPYQSHVACVYM